MTLPNVEGQPSKSERGKALRQVIAAFVANIGTINTGLIFGFSAVVIPQLQAADSLIPVDESQSSWVAPNCNDFRRPRLLGYFGLGRMI
ncbi:conserved hypothetical protein [Culex quinquefasciatus]|uniref:Uncharacterized protein n=1 Tax=Culex quinquefasciatus TaxID=7176 RepID=B0VZS3_CULQU|nr:conserved hypothetical protein [Culex quinquefasciatus]|eukprot:XP_001841957.1 conserved hypothetical protein [Culex quinquefasciatus]